MAFQILKEEELSLLTVQQRKQYERELDIYKKRAAFIEQIERYEKTEIKPFRPKVDFTVPPKGPEIKPYRRHEYKAELQEPASKPEVQILFHKMDVALKPEIPTVSVPEAKGIEVCRIDNPAPDLPVFPKPSKVGLSIGAFDEVRAALPETGQARISAPRQIRMENIASHVAITAPKRPKMAVLPENIPTDFRKTAVGLPDVDVQRPVFPDVQIPLDSRELKLPDITTEVKARTPEPDMQIPLDSRELKLPDVPTGVKARTPESAAMPKMKLSALPAIQQPRVRELRGFEAINIQLQKTPAIHVTEAKNVSFIQPKVRPKGLPATGKASVTTRDFQAPQFHVRSLEKAEIKAPVLSQLQPIRMKKAEPPEVKSVAVRRIRIPDISVEIPACEAVKIPDVRTVLESFFGENTDENDRGYISEEQ